jgi:hypothetical protein
MEWSPYSLDLNPDGNLWILLEKKVYKVYPDLKSLEG